ncbi:MAG: formylglycine-generating enzyme family protein [Cytophagales bacterium]|nr:MAG: formylglycine-generating enzyme family protein [Cytophagales bacterium]
MKKTLFFLLLGILHWQVAQSQTDSSSYTVTVNGVSFKMIKVKGGSFEMGYKAGRDGEDKYMDDAKPIHTVTLTDYYIAETEVTQALWRAVMGQDPPDLYNKGCDDCPVERVSWNDIVNEFLPKLEQLTGKKYRLPTEAEWEYAARGGQKSKGYTYAGSNDLNAVAWYGVNYSQVKYGSAGSTHPVKTKAPNELGLYDMTGNVWEWCQDGCDSKFYGSAEATKTNPANNNIAFCRVLRGGSWLYYVPACRVAVRLNNTPGLRAYDIGLRLLVL